MWIKFLSHRCYRLALYFVLYRLCSDTSTYFCLLFSKYRFKASQYSQQQKLYFCVCVCVCVNACACKCVCFIVVCLYAHMFTRKGLGSKDVCELKKRKSYLQIYNCSLLFNFARAYLWRFEFHKEKEKKEKKKKIMCISRLNNTVVLSLY